MSYLTPVLDFLLLTWFFWPVAVILPIWAYAAVVSDKDDYKWFPQFFIAIVVFAICWRYPDLNPFHSWQDVVKAVALYYAIGFLVSLTKWGLALNDFRKKDIKGTIARVRAEVEKECHQNHIHAKLNEVVSRVGYQYTDCTVDKVNGEVVVYLNWRKFPIGSWLSYWPFFSLSIVFEPLHKFGEWVVTILRNLYEEISKCFSVKG